MLLYFVVEYTWETALKYLYYSGIFIINFLLYFFSNIYTSHHHQIPLEKEFDYIIVGAGTAGCTILTGLPKNLKILLLEAGDYEPPNFAFDVPVMTPIYQGSSLDWSYSIDNKQNNLSCQAMKNNSCKWPIGKGFGGSNLLNNMIYYRNHPEDFRGWFTNKENYNYETDILPYFLKNEKLLEIEELKFQSEFSRIFLEDHKNNEKVEFFKPNVTQNNGMRWSICHHLISNMKTQNSNSNHSIVLGAFVTKILFHSDLKGLPTKSVQGVEFEKNGIKYKKFARKGVILSAGTIGTTKILLQSGVGPCDDLKEISIECIENLPVGRNLQDHISTGLDLITVNTTNVGFSVFDLISPKNFLQFVSGGLGPLTSIGCDIIGFLKNSSNSPPNLGFMIIPLGITTDFGVKLKHNFNIDDDVWKEYFEDLIYENVISILPILLHPKSKGYVKLLSNDPKMKPLINPNYLADNDDIKLLIEGIRLIKSFLENPKLQKIEAKIYEKHFPKCTEFKFDSDEYWECYIRHLTLTVYHPVGTCKMGSFNDNQTVVVQTNFKVKNIENLYVVDASIMPNLPSGNPNSVVMMIAQKFLNVLLKDTKIED